MNSRDFSKNKRKSVLDRLLLEQRAESMSQMEENRTDNFVSYLLFLEENYNGAVEKNNDVIERDGMNVIALANRVRYAHKTDVFKAEVHMKRLEEIKENDPAFERMHVVAEAEIAFCLARISPHCYSRALKLYRNVNERYPAEYLWKFGEAITLRRSVSANCNLMNQTPDVVTSVVRCSELLQEITEDAEEPLKAKAWAEMGSLNNLVDNGKHPFNTAIVENIRRQINRIPPTECYEHALELGPNNAFVLEECGVHYVCVFHKSQVSRNRDRAEDLLTKAVQLQPSTKSHHYLAKTLKEKAIRWGKGHHSKLSKDSPFVQSSIEHFQTSIDISDGCNMSAMSDLGFMYLLINEDVKAEETFKNIIQCSENLPSPNKKVFACEEVALLCLKKSRNRGLTEIQRDDFIDECLFFITKAVEHVDEMGRESDKFSREHYKHRKAYRTISSELKNSENQNTRRKVADLCKRVEDLGNS